MNLRGLIWRATGISAALVLISMPVFAERFTFNPAINFGYFSLPDVDLVGPSGASDVGFRVATELPFERRLPKGTFGLRYRPQFEQFEDFDELDNTAHQARLELKLRPTRLSSFALRVNYDNGLAQGRADSQRESDLFLTRRTGREIGGIELDYSNQIKRSWAWQGSVGYLGADFEEIEGFDAGVAGAVENRTEIKGSFGISRRLSRATAVGGRIERRQFELDVSGDETAELVSLFVRRELSQRTSFNVSIGAFRSSGSAARGANSGLEGSREGLQGTFSLTHSRRTLNLNLFANAGPTGGGALAGTSSDSVLGVSLRQGEEKRFSWNAAVRFARRDPSDPTLETLESISVLLGTELRILRFIGLRLGANYVDQLEGEDELMLFSDGGISLVWYPLAGKRISGQSREPVARGQSGRR